MKSNQVSKIPVTQLADSNQIELFNGIRVSDTFRDSLVVQRVQKPEAIKLHKTGKKKGQPVVGKSGKPLKVGSQDFTIVRVLPRETSAKNEDGSDKPSISSLHTDWDGQTVMGFEMKLRQEVARKVLDNLHSRMMAGEITFGHARCNNKNGNIGVHFRRAGGLVVGTITREQALAALEMSPEQYANWKSVADAQAGQ